MALSSTGKSLPAAMATGPACEEAGVDQSTLPIPGRDIPNGKRVEEDYWMPKANAIVVHR